MRIVVGGVGQLYQGDLDVGRRMAERLQSAGLGPEVVVEDFHYGAVAVSQRLEELGPDALILVGCELRSREPGSIHREVISADRPAGGQVQGSVEGAVTGYVTIDLVVDVARAFGASPSRIVVFEVEPMTTSPSTELSPAVAEAMISLERAVLREVELTPLFLLADEIRAALADGHLEESASLQSLRSILAGLEGVEAGRGWGEVFSSRDRLRLDISEGRISESMSHLDWSLWWALIEELDRWQKKDVAG